MLSRVPYKTVNLLIKCSWPLPQYAAGAGYLYTANLSDISSKDGNNTCRCCCSSVCCGLSHLTNRLTLTLAISTQLMQTAFCISHFAHTHTRSHRVANAILQQEQQQQLEQGQQSEQND